MKIVLLALAGNALRARAVLESEFAGAEIEQIQRARLETGSLSSRLKFFRSLKADVLAVWIENLEYQRGQNEISLLAALSGARKLLIIDAEGRTRTESRYNILLKAPSGIFHDACLSALAIQRSRNELGRLERAISEKTSIFLPEKLNIPPSMVFLRATPGPGTQAGGASTHINGFINAAAKAGMHIRMISNDRIAGLDDTKVRITVIPLEPHGSTRSAFDLRNNLVFTSGAVKEIAESPPDLLYQRYSRFTWAGVAASLSVRRPLFLEYNGSEVWVGKHWDDAGMFNLLERVEKLNLKAADRVFVVAAAERRNLLKSGVPDEKIIVNPNGVDVDVFHPGIGGDTYRERLEIGRDDVLVGFVGTFGPWHGVLELARAITLMPQDTNLRFLFVGAGKLRDQTEELISQAGFRDQVIFTGAVAHDEVPGLLDACDILVSPHVPLADGSEFFGSPTKLFEYMAMGKGIVASRLGQIAEVLRDEETALLVDPGNERALANAILRLAQSPGLRESLGQAAREKAIKKHTWKRNAECVLSVYRELCESTKANRGESESRS
jgi:glycosyltransferase involved in cell wall biosynthesis